MFTKNRYSLLAYAIIDVLDTVADVKIKALLSFWHSRVNKKLKHGFLRVTFLLLYTTLF